MISMKRSLRCISRTCSRSLSTATKSDFFGIGRITSKEVAGTSKSATKLAPDQVCCKYEPLIIQRQSQANKESTIDVTFGTIRLDGDNLPKKHGQFDLDSTQAIYNVDDIKQIYRPPITEDSSCETDINNEEADIEISPDYKDPYRIADVEALAGINDVLKLFKQLDSADKVNRYSNKQPLVFFFESTLSSQVEENQSVCEELPDKLLGRQLDDSELEETVDEASGDQNPPKRILTYNPETDKIPLTDSDEFSEEYQGCHVEISSEDNFDRSLDQKYDYVEEDQVKPNALEYLNQLRSKQAEPSIKKLKELLHKGDISHFKPIIKLDSKGFCDYREQTPNWRGCRRVDAINFVKNSIIYNNYDILAINKPYGLAVHADAAVKDEFNVDSLVKDIAKERRIEKVYLVHRLDLTTTGVLLFATSQERANMLNKLFKSEQIKKTYWCITTHIPELSHAIIDIPIGEYTVGGKSRSCVVPDDIESKYQLSEKPRHARKAITEYRVLANRNESALLEVKPTTGVKHQIRCHLSFGLNCPILGDHKYSHIERIAPQVLSQPILKALQLRQQKVRTLPMHLHAKTIVIPGAKANGETLFINAPLPPHFVQSMKALNLNVGARTTR